RGGPRPRALVRAGPSERSGSQGGGRRRARPGPGGQPGHRHRRAAGATPGGRGGRGRRGARPARRCARGGGTMTSLKAARHAALTALLRTRSLTRQAAVQEALHAKGFDPTQATISRDLDEVGAVKVRGDDGRLVYALPEPLAADGVDEAELRQVLALSLSAIIPTGNLVVVRTPPGHANLPPSLSAITPTGNLVGVRPPPGHANLLASPLDRAGLPGLAGTVAGDDTVLLVCTERTSRRAIARQLSALATQAGADPAGNGQQPDSPGGQTAPPRRIGGPGGRGLPPRRPPTPLSPSLRLHRGE